MKLPSLANTFPPGGGAGAGAAAAATTAGALVAVGAGLLPPELGDAGLPQPEDSPLLLEVEVEVVPLVCARFDSMFPGKVQRVNGGKSGFVWA